MANIAKVDELRQAMTVLDESEQVGAQAVQIATQIVQIAKSYSTLQAKAEDADDSTVFQRRFGAAVAKAKLQASSLTAAEKQLVVAFFNGVFS